MGIIKSSETLMDSNSIAPASCSPARVTSIYFQFSALKMQLHNFGQL